MVVVGVLPQTHWYTCVPATGSLPAESCGVSVTIFALTWGSMLCSVAAMVPSIEVEMRATYYVAAVSFSHP